jgi:hypothetical protein
VRALQLNEDMYMLRYEYFSKRFRGNKEWVVDLGTVTSVRQGVALQRAPYVLRVFLLSHSCRQP